MIFSRKRLTVPRRARFPLKSTFCAKFENFNQARRLQRSKPDTMMRMNGMPVRAVISFENKNRTRCCDGVEADKSVETPRGSCYYASPAEWQKSAVAAVHSGWYIAFLDKPVFRIG